MIQCTNCGSQYLDTDQYSAYYFESASFPRGSYTSPAAIVAAGEAMLFCPRCPLPHLDEVMKTGDDRTTAGDEDGV